VLGVLVTRRKEEEGDHIPIGMTALERSHVPSSSLWMASGLRRRFSMSATVWDGVGAAKTAGVKARASARVFEKSILTL
jgi:hypothetical protein